MGSIHSPYLRKQNSTAAQTGHSPLTFMQHKISKFSVSTTRKTCADGQSPPLHQRMAYSCWRSQSKQQRAAEVSVDPQALHIKKSEVIDSQGSLDRQGIAEQLGMRGSSHCNCSQAGHSRVQQPLQQRPAAELAPARLHWQLADWSALQPGSWPALQLGLPHNTQCVRSATCQKTAVVVWHFKQGEPEMA